MAAVERAVNANVDELVQNPYRWVMTMLAGTILPMHAIQKTTEILLRDAPDGARLDTLTRRLVELGVKVSVTSLNAPAIDLAMAAALSAGAEVGQVQETIALVSGLGAHSLLVSARSLFEMAAGQDPTLSGPLDVYRQSLWDRHVGDDKYWVGFEAEFPGFLDALLRLSPSLFQRFHEYCTAPWESGSVPGVTKELIAMASDATPSHQFLPGFRLHMRNALRLGAGRQEILEALAIAAEARASVVVD